MSLSWLSLGSMVGYTTTALYQLKNEDNKNVRMDDELGSWFAASFWLGGILACSFGGYLGGILGRRKLIIFTSPINKNQIHYSSRLRERSILCSGKKTATNNGVSIQS